MTKRGFFRAFSAVGVAFVVALATGCGDIKVAGSETGGTSTACKVDGDCASGDSCRVGSCQNGACSFTVQSGSCYANKACYAAGQELAGDRCKICQPGSSGDGFVSKTCGAGTTCAPTTGQCEAETDGTDIVDGTDGTAAGDATDGATDTTDSTDATDGATDTTDGTTDGTEPTDATDGATDGTGSTDTTDGTGSTDTTDGTGSTDTTDGTGSTDTTDGTDGTDGSVTPCTVKADCAAVPKTPCQMVTCYSGSCLVVDVDAGTTCSPEDVPNATCWTGVCTDLGECAPTPKSSGVCDDGNACTLSDSCSLGLCSGAPKVCNDEDACTADTCDGATGECVSTPLDAVACDDNNPCTDGDLCVGGACSGTNLCSCTQASDCPDDGNPCNGTPACLDVPGGGKACGVTPDSIIVCDASQDGQCERTACDPATGGCVTAILAGVPCGDGSDCTLGDACSVTGACVGTAIVCDDDNPCTDDVCVNGACVSTNNTSACNDNDACTLNDTCSAGACLGEKKVCNDGNVCTTDSCSEAGVCVFDLIPNGACDDGSVCTSGDVCQADKTCKGTAVVCDDNNPCTTDTCVAGVGCTKTNNANACDDNNLCTSGDVCSGGQCKPGAAVVCGAPGLCKVAACVPTQGCVVKNADDGSVCDDGSACTTGEKCTAGSCGGGTAVCSCQADADCDDGNLCNGKETCVTGAGGIKKCQAGASVVCPASGNPCQDNVCQKATGACLLTAANEGKSCGADDKCTVTKVCAAGTCKGTTLTCAAKTCYDVTGCDPLQGCLYGPSAPGTQCNDGNACTSSDACTSTATCAGKKIDCNDNNACTTDYCDSVTGCYTKTLVDGSGCEADGDLCTIDQCKTGNCTNTSKVKCDDGVACTVDACVAATGTCTYTPSSIACDDGNPCTTDVCTATGCSYTSVTDFTKCDDGNTVTTPDVCMQSKCVGGQKSFQSLPLFLPCLQSVGVAGATTFAGNFLTAVNYSAFGFNKLTFQCTTTLSSSGAVLKLDPTGSLVLVGAAKGTLAAQTGAVAVGEAGLVGLVSDDLTKVDFSGSGLHTALSLNDPAYLSTNYHAAGYTFAGSFTVNEDWFQLAGRSSATGKGVITRCYRSTPTLIVGTPSWSCSTSKAPVTPGSKDTDYYGATLFTIPTPCPPGQLCIYSSQVGGGVLGSRTLTGAFDGMTDLLGDGVYSTNMTTAGDGARYKGSVQVDTQTAWHYGTLPTGSTVPFLRRCYKNECTNLAGPGAYSYLSAYAYDGNVVFLAVDATGEGRLIFLAKDADPYVPKAYRTYVLPALADGDTPVAITGSPNLGFTVVGVASSKQSFTIWRFLY